MKDDRPPGAGRGILLGEALPLYQQSWPIKYERKKFVEMQDMLPDMWLFADEGEHTSWGSR